MAMENADDSESFGMRITNSRANHFNDDDQLHRWCGRSQLALPRHHKGYRMVPDLSAL
jgi:hypothetical protein